MSIPSKRAIKAELKRLRALVESDRDPITQRIAYAMEAAITWATEDTVGWEHPHKMVADETRVMLAEVAEFIAKMLTTVRTGGPAVRFSNSGDTR